MASLANPTIVRKALPSLNSTEFWPLTYTPSSLLASALHAGAVKVSVNKRIATQVRNGEFGVSIFASLRLGKFHSRQIHENACCRTALGRDHFSCGPAGVGGRLWRVRR